jgi:hypothetical protein
MKNAWLAESPADEEVLKTLTEAILKQETQRITYQGLRSRGWHPVMQVLPAVIKELHYHTEAAGLLVIVDSNGSLPHVPEHDSASKPECRLCRLRRIAKETLGNVRPRANLPPLKVALGLAVPAIEAWLLCGTDARVSEAAWSNGLKESPQRMPYSKEDLKRSLYGTSHPSQAVKATAMSAAGKELAEKLSLLEAQFPHGFGALVRDFRNW